MHPKIKANLVTSIKILAHGPHLLPASEIETVGTPGQGPHLTDKLIRIVDTQIPWFFQGSDGKLSTPQSSFFGLYALRNILRGTLIGASFIPPGDLLLEKTFLAPSVAIYYTACLHLLLSYLAIEGHVLITPVYGRPFVEYTEHGAMAGHRPITKPTAVCSLLTEAGQWVFEGRSRTHRTYWSELDRLMLNKHEQPPGFLVEFSRYLVGPYVEKNSSELDIVRTAISQLQIARHEALYGGYGLDPWSDDLLTNRDAEWAPLDLRAKEFKSFAYGLLNHDLSEINEIIKHFDRLCPRELQKSSLKIWGAVNTPPFDLLVDLDELLQPNLCDVPSLRKLVEQFLSPKV